MRKTFTTTIDTEIQKHFKVTCVLKEVKMNDVLENFMMRYINGELDIVPLDNDKEK